MSDAAPSLFISHKHADRQIATVLAQFIEERSVGRINVHMSSSLDLQGPRVGPAVNAQLRDVLRKTEVLILIYTSEDQDWSYCMWECGMAMHPESPDANLIVFQCGRDVPSLFRDDVRVNPRNRDNIKSFTRQLLREAGFFRSGVVLPDLKDSYLEYFATDLHSRLSEVLSRLDDEQVEVWHAWPYLRLELPRAETDKIGLASEADGLNLVRQIVSDHAKVVRSALLSCSEGQTCPTG
jgi:hypothetical protein